MFPQTFSSWALKEKRFPEPLKITCVPQNILSIFELVHETLNNEPQVFWKKSMDSSVEIAQKTLWLYYYWGSDTWRPSPRPEYSCKGNFECTELSPLSASLHSELTRCEKRKNRKEIDQESIREQIFKGLARISH